MEEQHREALPESFGPVKASHCLMAANLFKTLSNPLRLQIFCILFEGEKTVSQLEALSSGSQSHISQFLKRMEYEKLVRSRREGKYKYYSLADPKVKELMESLMRIFSHG
jgi:DNA-binding transcriptional ArsR family regulator